MKITRANASLISSYNSCALKYYMNYVLKLESPSDAAALRGSIVHKAIALLATSSGKTIEEILEESWISCHEANKYVELDNKKDYKKCLANFRKIIEDKDYNPTGLTILGIEKKFEIALPGKEWKVEGGQLVLSGVIDMISEVDDDTIMITDWKTGAQSDIFTGEKIDEDYLLKSPQPRIYNLAASYLWPQYKNILVTFYYTEHAGPLTISFDEEDVALTLASVWKFFSKVKKTETITRNRSWRCKFCAFSKSDICNHVYKELAFKSQDDIAIEYQSMSFADQVKKFPKQEKKDV